MLLLTLELDHAYNHSHGNIWVVNQGSEHRYGIGDMADRGCGVRRKEYYEVPYAELRCIVEPSFTERSVVKHSEYLKTARVIQSAAASVSGSEVITAAGDHVPFDFLVISTGTVYNGPSRRDDRVKEYEAEAAKLQIATSVLIVGGGPVGVELAGEIATDFPDKKVFSSQCLKFNLLLHFNGLITDQVVASMKVTLVHSGDRLLQFLGNKASQKALNWLQSKKVEVILNDR